MHWPITAQTVGWSCSSQPLHGLFALLHYFCHFLSVSILSPFRGAAFDCISPLAGKKSNSIHGKLEDLCEESEVSAPHVPDAHCVCVCSAFWDGAAVFWTEEGVQMYFWTFIRQICSQTVLDQFICIADCLVLLLVVVGGGEGFGIVIVL